MKQILGLILLVLIASGYESCQKKQFKKVHVKGVLFDWSTNKSVPGSISIRGMHSHKEENFGLGNFQTDSDGRFNITTSAVKSGDYSFTFNTADLTNELSKRQNIKDGATFDFGELIMSHTFICKINLTCTIPDKESITFGYYPFATVFTNATTVYYERRPFTKEQFAAAPEYPLTYTLIGANINERKFVTLPIGTSDTVSIDISY